MRTRYSVHFDLIPDWLPLALQDWLEQGQTCDITARRVKGRHGANMVRVEIEASTSEELAAKRKALNAVMAARGYGSEVVRERPNMKKAKN